MDRIGKYRVEEEVGTGGMGTVYRAKDPASGEPVAIKVLLAEFSNDSLYVSRFMREIGVMKELHHPNIIAILDSGKESASVYFVMEYVDGLSLHGIMHKEKVLPVRRALQIAIQLAEALHYAHEHRVIHRDVKPSNILLAAEDTVKLGDFGVARSLEGTRLTSTGGIVGSPYYMSPEQAQGMVADTGSDIYSLGVILYEMVTGRLPFKAVNPVQLIQLHQYSVPEGPSSFNQEVSEELSGIIMGFIERRPEKRLRDGSVVAKVLRKMLEDRGC